MVEVYDLCGSQELFEAHEMVAEFQKKYKVVETLTALSNQMVQVGDGASLCLYYSCLVEFARLLGEQLPGGSRSAVLLWPEEKTQ